MPVDSLGYDRLRAYILYCINILKISENQLHSRLNAIKFYFERVLHKPDFFVEIPRPKKPSTMPKVLSQKELKRIFDRVRNRKHLLMLQLCYGMGLGVSEVVKLKVSDIESGRMQVLIEAGKGTKTGICRYRPRCWICCGSITNCIAPRLIFLKVSMEGSILSAVSRRCLRMR